jgi:radical SAM protein with 4Fe4S-binding SPASM domain
MLPVTAMLEQKGFSAPRLRFFGDATTHRPLQDLLPLATPLRIHIDPTSACNLRCQFCPSGHPELLSFSHRTNTMMPLPLFRKIIDDLSHFPHKPLRLHLYKDGEPFLHPDLVAMVTYASGQRVAESVETTTNGTLLSGAWGHALARAGLDRIRISVQHVSDEGYLGVTNRTVSYLDLVRKAREFYESVREHPRRPLVHVKLLDTGLADDQKNQFLQDFAGSADELYVDGIMGWNHPELFDFALGRSPLTGMDSSVRLNPSRDVCPQPFYTMAINSNGFVSACCVDWAREVVVGDINKETIVDIWRGPRLRALRLLHLERRRAQHPACSSCHYISGLPSSSDLDADAEHLRLLYGEPL